ncbi:MAG: mechanosensitive ion channel [Parvibaculum sp.]
MQNASTLEKSPRRTFVFALALFSWLTLLAPAATMAATPEPAWKFTRTIDGWTSTLNQIERGFSNRRRTIEQADEHRATLQALRDDANLARTAAKEQVDETERLLAALGPMPEEGTTPEAHDVAEQRASYGARLADFRGRAAQAQLMVRRIDRSLRVLSKMEQAAVLQKLLEHQGLPVSPTNLAAAPGDFWAYLDRLNTSAITSLMGAQTEPETKPETEPEGNPESTLETRPKILIVFFLILSLSASVFASRRLLINRWGRNPNIAAPSYTRRLIAASVEPMANGLLPALIAASLWYGLNWAFTLNEDSFRHVIEGGLTALLIIIAAYALPQAALSPEQPNWRIAPIKAKSARYITKRIGALGLLFGLDVFVSYTTTTADASWLSIYAAIIATLEAVLIIDLLRPALWKPDPTWHETEAANSAPRSSSTAAADRKPTHIARGLQILRVLVGAIAVASVIAGWSGYTNLSAYLIGGLLGSATIVGGLFLLKFMLAEWISIMMHRRKVIDGLNLSDNGADTVNFWLFSFMQVSILIAGALIVSQIWGLQLGETGAMLYNLATAIQIGDVTISFSDIAIGIVTLFVGLALFRAAKRLLVNTILPQTRLDPGAQYSIAAIFGYVGIVISTVVAASVLGMEFQNLIIIAGALSVGIGFGLQNIANNFVSGLILLFERPVRVGDLIEINGILGHVTHINVRRTEIETFQKSEVMIPNSDLVSTVFTNWTHTDRKGRIDINVGVAYGSDTELVRKTLLEAAETVDRILAWPQPDVLFLDFGDSSLNFQLRCFTSDVSSRITTASNLRFEIDRLFREHHIEIPFPQRVVHMAAAKPAPAPTGTGALQSGTTTGKPETPPEGS